LTTLELPFSYVEQGESKSALVKVALCEKCVKKLMWKRQKEKEKATTGLDLQTITGDTGHVNEDPLAKRRKKKSRDDEIPETSSSFHPETRRRRSSRSRSPRRSHAYDISSKRPHSIPRKSGD
jgi:protein FRA10AC1